MPTQDATRELAVQLGGRLIERRDVKAIQDPKTGGYRPDGKYVKTDTGWTCDEYFPFKVSDIISHLNGEKTLGHYLVSTEGKCRVFVLDIDLCAKGQLRTWNSQIETFEGRDVEPREIWKGSDSPDKLDLIMQLRSLGEGLALRAQKLLEIPTAIAYSGSKGVHVYGFIGSMDAGNVRAAAVEVLESFESFRTVRGNAFWKHIDAYDSLEIEVFPKQDEVKADGFGNLVRLPLGVHQKSKTPGFFIDTTAGYDTMRADDPLLALTAGSFR